MRRPLVIAALAGAAGLIAEAPALPADPPVPRALAAPLTPEELAAIVDIDDVQPSPDGRHVALLLRRGDAASNRVEQAWVLVPAAGGAARPLGDAGAPELVAMADGQRNGVFVPPPLAWSPDSRRLAVAPLVEGARDVWIIGVDGHAGRRRIALDHDVRQLRWDADGLVAATGSQRRRDLALALADEQRSGLRLDDGVMPMEGAVRRVPPPSRLLRFRLDPLAATATPIADPPQPVPTSDARLVTRGAAGDVAWTRPVDPSRRGAQAETRLHARFGGRPRSCTAAACAGALRELHWVGGTLVFRRAEGYNRRVDGYYAWNGRRVRRLAADGDTSLEKCRPLGRGALACRRSRATEPDRLVRVDVASGAQTVLHEPNPSLPLPRFGAVQPLLFTSAAGEGFARLVLPPSHRPGARHPMVVVQYRTRGFLRGGVGDEYPVHAFAARGLAVLVTERPMFYDSLDRPAAPHAAAVAFTRAEAAARPLVAADVEAAIAAAVATGAVDPGRIGLTGLSDGAATVYHLLAHRPDRFRAAAASSPYWDPVGHYVVTPALRAYHRAALGDPADPGSQWAALSPAAHAGRYRAPLLLQLADRELTASMQLVTALEAARKPFDAYVFPDEYHVKWQPAHRLAIYRRNLDWFDFWLQGREDPDPGKAAQYCRWRRLARAVDGRSAEDALPLPLPQPAFESDGLQQGGGSACGGDRGR